MSLDHELMNKILLESRQIAQLNERLAEQLQSSQDTAGRLKSDVSKLQQGYEELTSDSRMKFKEQEVQEKDLAIKRMQGRLEEYEDEIGKRENTISEMQNRLSELQGKLSTKNELIGELGRNLKLKDQEFTEHQQSHNVLAGTVGGLHEELGSRDDQIKEFHASVDQLEGLLHETKSQLEENLKDKMVMSKELERAKTDNDDLRTELKKHRDNLRVLIDDLRIKDRMLHDTQRAHLEKQKGLKKLGEDFRMLQEQLAVLDKANTEVLHRLQGSNAVNRDLEQELAHQKETVRKMDLHYRTMLKVAEERHRTQVKAIIAQNTQDQLHLKMELEELKEKMKAPETEEPGIRPLNHVKLDEMDLGFMQATPEELLPMVKTALDHGDSEDKIRRSLVNSGYEATIVDKAIEKAK